MTRDSADVPSARASTGAPARRAAPSTRPRATPGVIRTGDAQPPLRARHRPETRGARSTPARGRAARLRTRYGPALPGAVTHHEMNSRASGRETEPRTAFRTSTAGELSDIILRDACEALWLRTRARRRLRRGVAATVAIGNVKQKRAPWPSPGDSA